jgi:hypothetical protein
MHDKSAVLPTSLAVLPVKRLKVEHTFFLKRSLFPFIMQNLERRPPSIYPASS